MIREFVTFASASRLHGALAIAIVIAAGGAAQAQQKPRASRSEPAKPTLVGQFSDWGTFATPQSKAKTCYALSQPKDRAPGALKRDPAYIFVTHRPADKVRNEVAIIMGFDVKPDSKPVAEIGDAEFDLVAKGEHLWLRNAADEGKFIEAMRKGARLTVKAHSTRNNLTTDTYSLIGVSQALDRADKECP